VDLNSGSVGTLDGLLTVPSSGGGSQEGGEAERLGPLIGRSIVHSSVRRASALPSGAGSSVPWCGSWQLTG
jgi:hypothetical protein